MKWAHKKQGFTIVELLIVIVVIAILAAITIVGYTGIQNQARSAGVKNEVSQAVKQLKNFATYNAEAFPASITSCPTPTAGNACVLKDVDGTIVYAVENANGARSFCVSIQNAQGESFFSTEKGTVLPGTCEQQSCYAIQQAGGSHGSGNYWIKPTTSSNPMQVYCDMTTEGGGWTLIVSNPGPANAWNIGNYRLTNPTAPSLTTRYSIIEHADGIKSNIGGNLNYMLDASSRGRWGGVWEAPFSATLNGTSPQNTATLIQQFDTWTQDTVITDGTQTLSNVVPWISSSGSGPGLVTWGGTGNWYGTIITNNANGSWNPAPYINTAQIHPGVIWYWVR